ncbi:hypothetical protein [Nonomuraea angiospora]|uniref:hypothetical protein n=1 Tax=Nonomuraea angiospora TaxID=46172 RepID=UPI003B5CDD5A
MARPDDEAVLRPGRRPGQHTALRCRAGGPVGVGVGEVDPVRDALAGRVLVRGRARLSDLLVPRPCGLRRWTAAAWFSSGEGGAEARGRVGVLLRVAEELGWAG